MAIVVENETDVASFKDFKLGATEEAAVTGAGAGAAAEKEKQEEPVVVTLAAGQRVFISPLAKKTASDNKIAIEHLFGKGTGPLGRVLKADVDQFIAQGGVKKAVEKPKVVEKKEEKKAAAAAPPPPKKPVVGGPPENPFVDVPLTNMRKVIASRLLEAKSTIPHFYLTVSVTMDEALK